MLLFMAGVIGFLYWSLSPSGQGPGSAAEEQPKALAQQWGASEGDSTPPATTPDADMSARTLPRDRGGSQEPGALAGNPDESDHDAVVDSRISELLDLAMTDKSDSLSIILSELTNPDARIRKTAVEATVQFGSREAIAALQEALAGSEDVEEKASIGRAIEFLDLPSSWETMASSAENGR